MSRPARLALLLALAAVTAAPGLGEARPPPVVDAPPAAPPPIPMPDVSLGSRFVQDAAVYMAYMRAASAISPNFTDSSSVGTALQVGSAYEPNQLRRGAVAYAAIAALGDEAFVANVRQAGATPGNRYAIVARIFANPAYALRFADGSNAAGLAKAALIAGGMQLYDAGDAVANSAYSMQHQAWSLAEAPQHDARVSMVKSLAVTQRSAAQADRAALELRIGGDASAIPPIQPAQPPYTSLVTHAIALAALAAIGQAGDSQAANLAWLTDDYFMDHCAAETKLSLFECLAVAKPNYEDVFCLGTHAMKDTGACLVRSADGAVPIEIATAPLRVPPARVGEHATRHVTRHRRR